MRGLLGACQMAERLSPEGLAPAVVGQIDRAVDLLLVTKTVQSPVAVEVVSEPEIAGLVKL